MEKKVEKVAGEEDNEVESLNSENAMFSSSNFFTENEHCQQQFQKPHISFAPQFCELHQYYQQLSNNLDQEEQKRGIENQDFSSQSPFFCMESNFSRNIIDNDIQNVIIQSQASVDHIESNEEQSSYLRSNLRELDIQERISIPHPSTSRVHQNQKYYQCQYQEIDNSQDKSQDGQPTVLSIRSGEPYMKITILKSSGETNSIQNEYFVTPRGMVGSLRTRNEGDITIGRQNVCENGFRPNDILLSVSDLAISRTHCRILCQNGFSTRLREIPQRWLEFCKCFHQKSIAKGIKYIPNDIKRIIISYLIEPKQFYIQDLGSVHGTYLKVFNDCSYPLRSGQNYLIGTDIYVNVIDQQTSKKEDQDQSQAPSYNDFMKYIAREYASQTQIYGIQKSEFAKHLINKDNKTLINYSEKAPWPFSFVKTEVITSGGISTYHLFVSQQNNQHLEYKLGRAPNCDIVISQNTISREQCRFLFEKSIEEQGKYTWKIRDGNEQKESSNGTWLCLTDYKLRAFKMPSPLEPLKQGSEIKLSDSILKIEWSDPNLL